VYRGLSAALAAAQGSRTGEDALMSTKRTRRCGMRCGALTQAASSRARRQQRGVE